MESGNKRGAALFWGIIAVVVAADVVTKRMAEEYLARGLAREVFGETVRLTLVYNPGAAFGFHLGPYSRWIFMVLTIGALAILLRLYRSTRAGDLARTIALALVCGGAVGNLIDRVRSRLGVVDFIDVGVSERLRWPTFNVADMAVSVGAFLLAWVLWGEDREIAAAQAAQAAAATGGGDAAPRDTAALDGAPAGAEARGEASVAQDAPKLG